MTAKSAAAILAITLVIAILTLHRLGAGDVCTGNEAVEGVFVQQMAEPGHLMFPVENGNVPMYSRRSSTGPQSRSIASLESAKSPPPISACRPHSTRSPALFSRCCSRSNS